MGALGAGHRHVSERPDPRPQSGQPRCGLDEDCRCMAERLARERAALRRVATLVARGAETSEVFAAVAREVAEVMDLPVAAVQRYDDDDETMTVIAAWCDRPHPFHPRTPWPLPPPAPPPPRR